MIISSCARDQLQSYRLRLIRIGFWKRIRSRRLLVVLTLRRPRREHIGWCRPRLLLEPRAPQRVPRGDASIGTRRQQMVQQLHAGLAVQVRVELLAQLVVRSVGECELLHARQLAVARPDRLVRSANFLNGTNFAVCRSTSKMRWRRPTMKILLS